MIAKMGMVALLGTMGTAAMATPASAHEGQFEQRVEYGYARGYDRDHDRGRFERERAWRERMRWNRYRRWHHFGDRDYGMRY